MSSTVDRAYADALFQAGLENQKLELFHHQFSMIIEVMNERFRLLFANPNIQSSQKTAIIEETFSGIDRLLLNFLKVLVKNNRFMAIYGIHKAFNKRYYNYFNILEATIYSASELSEEQVQLIDKRFSQKYNKEIKSKVVVDTSLIAGLKVKIEDDVYDNSLIHQLRKMKEKV